MSMPVMPAVGSSGPGGYNGGYVYDPTGAERFTRSLSHGGTLMRAAPHLIHDGEGMDLMPYRAFYESEILNGDGSVWKARGVEPPYISQVGNNCTSRGDQVVMDLLQCMDAMIQDKDELDEPIPYRTCCEATYAFSLFEGGMRGDQGCTGFATAKSATTIGRVSYREVDGKDEEDRARLVSWANNPEAVVKALKAKAEPYRLDEAVRIDTVDEARAWLFNRGLITIASGVGFETPRDSRGICEARGQWMHQMGIIGYLCSDGVETFVIAQSWGKDNPRGPTPFGIPSFCFRAHAKDVAKILQWKDSWGHRTFKGFERRRLPERWTGIDWSGVAV